MHANQDTERSVARNSVLSDEKDRISPFKIWPSQVYEGNRTVNGLLNSPYLMIPRIKQLRSRELTRNSSDLTPCHRHDYNMVVIETQSQLSRACSTRVELTAGCIPNR
jgi:hypothetical protein